MIYTKSDRRRLVDVDSSNNEYRTQWRRDYARLIHSPAFRRLQGKTQLFPGYESDFFRNRLTHSLEVAQIAKSIAIRLNHLLKQQKSNYRISPCIVEFAGLAHDIGHPPFGHQGEEALDEKMINAGGFEGNAQTLRLLTKIEKKNYFPGTDTDFGFTSSGKDLRAGLNLTCRSLASILKYDREIPQTHEKRSSALVANEITRISPVKGYYESEKDIVTFIKSNVSLTYNPKEAFKTIECQIMDIADDIAYSTYDLEDAFKGGFIKPIDLFSIEAEVTDRLIKKVNDSLNISLTRTDVEDVLMGIFDDQFKHFYEIEDGLEITDETLDFIHLSSIRYATRFSNEIAKNGYLRTNLSSRLIDRFISSVDFEDINTENPCLSKIRLHQDKAIEVEVLKYFTYEFQISSPKLKMVEFRGKEIISLLFDTLKQHPELLPYDYRAIYNISENENHRLRSICDFIAGMTDRYAVEFYAKLKSENAQTIFKHH